MIKWKDDWVWTDKGTTHTELHLRGLLGDEDSILYHGANWPMEKAHKRLIAAAPKLLEACRSALHDLKEWQAWSESLEYIDMSDAGRIEYPSLKAMENIQAAIAEAEKAD